MKTIETLTDQFLNPANTMQTSTPRSAESSVTARYAAAAKEFGFSLL